MANGRKCEKKIVIWVVFVVFLVVCVVRCWNILTSKSCVRLLRTAKIVLARNWCTFSCYVTTSWTISIRFMLQVLFFMFLLLVNQIGSRSLWLKATLGHLQFDRFSSCFVRLFLQALPALPRHSWDGRTEESHWNQAPYYTVLYWPTEAKDRITCCTSPLRHGGCRRSRLRPVLSTAMMAVNVSACLDRPNIPRQIGSDSVHCRTCWIQLVLHTFHTVWPSKVDPPTKKSPYRHLISSLPRFPDQDIQGSGGFQWSGRFNFSSMLHVWE